MDKPQIEVGDVIESVETRWVGVVAEVGPDPNGDTMLKCKGIDLIVWVLVGRSVRDAVCDDDTAWYAPDDVNLVSKAPKGGWQ